MWKKTVRQNRLPGSLSVWLLAFLFTYLLLAPAFANPVAPGPVHSYFPKDSSSQLSIDYALLLSEAAAPHISLSGSAKRTVEKYIRKNRESLESISKRCTDYFRTIGTIFKERGLPEQLKYLAVVESDLKSTAVSHCGAVGVWQLMPETARNFGLKVGRHNDERRHLYKSTVAVAKYLQCLYKDFGDWLLVMAAYNGGAGSVHAAIKKSGSRNYYVLQHYLHAETKGHVQHFIATHYFFEGAGSVATLTKAEAARHLQNISDYLSKRTCEIEQAAAAALPDQTVRVETEKKF